MTTKINRRASGDCNKTERSIEECIITLFNSGYPTKALRLHKEALEQAELDSICLFDRCTVDDADETADEYFNAFTEGGLKAPPFQFRLLAAGRCFTLSKGQKEILRSMFFSQVHDQAVIHDIGIKDGMCYMLVLKFPNISKVSQLALAPVDFQQWVINSKLRDDELKAEEAEKELMNPKPVSQRKKRQSEMDKLAEKMLKEGDWI